MALFGGITLMGPVLVIALYPGRTIVLVTVSITIVLFAFVLAFMAKNMPGKDILAATAAYAAILVVFVGTSSSPSSSGVRVV